MEKLFSSRLNNSKLFANLYKKTILTCRNQQGKDQIIQTLIIYPLVSVPILHYSITPEIAVKGNYHQAQFKGPFMVNSYGLVVYYCIVMYWG